jgi:hypothetical protein
VILWEKNNVLTIKTRDSACNLIVILVRSTVVLIGTYNSQHPYHFQDASLANAAMVSSSRFRENALFACFPKVFAIAITRRKCVWIVVVSSGLAWIGDNS